MEKFLRLVNLNKLVVFFLYTSILTYVSHVKLRLSNEIIIYADDYLSFHLSDLVRMAFVGATGESDALRLCGLRTLQMIIQQYARAPEPDFPGHLLLEQYQAQVSDTS